jgi:hypothetical protein
MNDPAAMCPLQAFRNFSPILEHLLGRQRALGQTICQRLAFQVLHDQKVSPILASNVEKRANVLVLQGGNGLRFAFEALLGIWPLREIGRQYLDGDCAI